MSTARIQLHLDVHEPIELMDLTMSFQALAFEYRKFLSEQMRRKSGSRSDPDVKLYITKIENNCILAEMGGAVAIMGQLFTVMDYVTIFIDFAKRLDSIIDYFKNVGRAGQVDPKSIPHSKAQCARIADLLDVVAKNQDGRLGLNVVEYASEESPTKSVVHLKVGFTSDDAFMARRGALLAQKALEYKGEADHRSVLMYFYQTNTDEPKATGSTGDKAIIKAVSDKPLPVYFISEMDQQKISYTLEDPSVNPFKASFIVDVNVETDRNDIPRFYRIVHVHEVITGNEDEDQPPSDTTT